MHNPQQNLGQITNMEPWILKNMRPSATGTRIFKIPLWQCLPNFFTSRHTRQREFVSRYTKPNKIAEIRTPGKTLILVFM